MKKILSILPALLLMFAFIGNADAAYEESVDYSTVMIRSAAKLDYEAGEAAEAAREEKLVTMGDNSYPSIDFEELVLLSKIIYAEAGSYWLSDEWKMSVGEVVLNRVASPEFPNTIAEVLAQPGQYYGANSYYFNRLIPNERCVQAAFKLLNGERIMQPNVVFQANFPQGNGIYKAYNDRYLGATYFCVSTRSYLYEM